MKQTICPHCGEKENFHFNYDYTQKHPPLIDILCNECGEFFNSKEQQKKLIKEIMDADAKDGLYKQQTALSWFIEQLEEKGDLRETPSIRIVQINIDTSEYLDLKRQAKAMEKEQKSPKRILKLETRLDGVPIHMMEDLMELLITKVS